MPHAAASDLGLHCFRITHLGVFSLQWVNLFMPFRLDNLVSWNDPFSIYGDILLYLKILYNGIQCRPCAVYISVWLGSALFVNANLSKN